MHVRKLIVSLAGAVTLAATAAPAQAASLTCPAEPTAREFSRWLDPSQYAAVPGGSFEADGWTLAGGARRVSGQHPWNPAGTGVLELPAGAKAVSPPFCIAVDRPTVRMFARNTGSPLGALNARLIVPTLLGDLRLPIGLALDPQDRWAPTLPMPVLVNLLTLLGGPGYVRLELSSGGAGAGWQVDDVYVDPYSKG
jgi:hypothetical protein